MSTETADPTIGVTIDEHEEAKLERGWNVVLWNDDVTPMETVIVALVEVVTLKEADAVKATLQIHQHGKGIVATEDRSKAEQIKMKLEAFKLTVSLEEVE